MGYAFISYSTKNQQSADAVRELLMNNNIEVWMAPYSIPAGALYASCITSAIRDCDCFVIILTDESQKSQAVNREAEIATNFGKPFVGIRIGNVELNDAFIYYVHNSQIETVNSIIAQSYEMRRVVTSVGEFVNGGNPTPVSRGSFSAPSAFKKSCASTAFKRPSASWNSPTKRSPVTNSTDTPDCDETLGLDIGVNVKDGVMTVSSMEYVTPSITRDGITKLIIGNGVATVNKEAFTYMRDLREVVLPKSLKAIDDYAFSRCSRLKRVVMHNGVEKIGTQAFAHCNNLSDIALPPSLEYIGESAFMDCAIKNVAVSDRCTVCRGNYPEIAKKLG